MLSNSRIIFFVTSCSIAMQHPCVAHFKTSAQLISIAVDKKAGWYTAGFSTG